MSRKNTPCQLAQKMVQVFMIACMMVTSAVPVYAQDAPPQVDEISQPEEAGTIPPTTATDTGTSDSDLAANPQGPDLSLQASEVLLQFRVLEVYADEETGLDWPGSDEISLGGAATSRYGTNKIDYRNISSDFDEGETKRYDPPMVLQEFRLADFPSDVLVSLVMIERDNGGSDGVTNRIVDFVHEGFVGAVIASASTGNVMALALTAGIEIAIKELVPYLKDFLAEWWKDDIFNPAQGLAMYVESQTSLLPGNVANLQSEVWFRDHGGRYRVTYDWNLVQVSATEVAVAGADSPMSEEPWSHMQRQTPPSFWTDSHVLGTPAPGNLVSAFSGGCMDVRDALPGDGAIVQQWRCFDANQKNQVWRLVPEGLYYKIVAEHSGKCLDVRDVLMEDGAVVQQWNCIPEQPNQLWVVRPVGSSFQVIAAHSGKCLDLDIKFGGTHDGDILQQWECLGAGQYNQLWNLETPAEPPPPHVYKLWIPMIGR